MKSPTAGFRTAMVKTGTTPVWLLELDGNYYADRAISDGTNSYTASVIEWSDIAAISDRMSGGGVLTATSIRLEASIHADVRIGNEAKVYLWFENESLGASDRLLMFSGIVADPISLTETTITCSIKSIEEARNAVVGEILDLDTFPNSTSDAVGEVLPVVYGSVNSHECLSVDAGGFTTLKVSISDSATTVELTKADDFSASDSVLIDGEIITLGLKSGATFSGCTRGVAVAHDRGATVVHNLPSYDFLVADHAITSISTVYADGVAVDSSTWSVQTVGGRGYVRFTDRPSTPKTVDISVDVTDDSSYTAESYSVESVTDNITNPTTSQTVEDVDINSGGSLNSGSFSYLDTTSQDVTFSSSSASGVTTYDCALYTNNAARIAVKYDGGSWYYVLGTATTNGEVTVFDTQNITLTSSSPVNKITWFILWANGTGSWQLRPHIRKVAGLSIGISKQGQVNYTASSLTNSSYAAGDLPAAVTGNTAAETRYAKEIRVDCTGYNLSKPSDIVEHLLLNYGNSITAGDLDASVASDGEGYGSSYPLGFAITALSDLMTLCRKIAHQTFSSFQWDGGKAKLTRYSDTTADISIGKVDVLLNSASMGWTPYTQIFNTISAPYSYRSGKPIKVHVESNTVSVSSYGVKDGSSHFKLDLVNSSTTANNVVEGYLGKLASPKRVVTLVCTLAVIRIERGDIVAITHDLEGGWSSKKFQVLETHFIVGSGTQKIPDSIRIIAEEI